MRTDSALENALQIANQRQPDSASRFELCVLYLEPFAGSLTSLSIDFLATSLDHYLSSSLALLLTGSPNGSLSGSLLSINCLFHYLAHCFLRLSLAHSSCGRELPVGWASIAERVRLTAALLRVRDCHESACLRIAEAVSSAKQAPESTNERAVS